MLIGNYKYVCNAAIPNPLVKPFTGKRRGLYKTLMELSSTTLGNALHALKNSKLMLI